MKPRELTELEQCVLGVIWRDGPMTAYEVAATFSTSLSPYWSGSAGAIYPLVKRLQRRGFLGATHRAWNGKRRTLLNATPAGVKLLQAWLTPPLDPAVGAPSFDPVRTRLYFVEVLPRAQRALFFDEAERAVRTQLADVRRQRKEDADAGRKSEALGQLGAMYELQARLRWLRAARKELLA